MDKEYEQNWKCKWMTNNEERLNYLRILPLDFTETVLVKAFNDP